MGADIHGSIEYSDWVDEKTGDFTLVMSFAKLSLPRDYIMFGALGYRGRDLEKYLSVPLNGWPRSRAGNIGRMGWTFQADATVLVVRDAVAGKDGYSERGYLRESDGQCITPGLAKEYLRYGSQWLDDDYHHSLATDSPEYRRMSDPDIHSVNWCTTKDLAKAISAARRFKAKEYGGGGSWDHEYRAVLASMRELEKDTNKKMVRFIYGFDN